LSLYAPVSGPYWADPLNQAVMKAWQAGIVVVVAAGNSGPNAGTITAPGNVPYVITVGALKSGRYTQSGYDELAAYSSRGPTESAFVKPDLLVPASRTIAPMAMNSTLGSTLRSLRSSNKDACTIDSKVVPPDMAITGDTPSYCYENTKLVDFKIGALAQKHAYYQLSGTSMAAAEVSGVAALIIQRNPSLSNDQVKYRLLATARPATVTATGESVYTPWEQGAGLLTIRDAVFTTTLELANQGMDIDLDLDVTSETQIHYWGNTVWNEASGEFSLIDPQTLEPVAVWNGTQRIWGGTQRIWGGSDTDQPTADTNQPADDTNQPAPDSTWAGAERIWGGSTSSASPSTATHSETLIED
ncbi:MAG TPA: S8 family serine peptidase, partial [Herpetosiphonaceae bacterium]|nr:S8 family serine peptidase [Herpetosiphonaceae bacterium]